MYALAWECHIFFKSSYSMVIILFRFFNQVLFDAIDLHTNVRISNAQHRGYFLVTEIVQHQQRNGSVDLIQPGNLIVKPGQSFVNLHIAFSDDVPDVVQRFVVTTPPLLSGPLNGRVQCNTVYPGGHRRLSTKHRNRTPYLDDDLLEQVVAVHGRKRVGPQYLKHQRPVLVERGLEGLLMLGGGHAIGFMGLVPLGEGNLTIREYNLDIPRLLHHRDTEGTEVHRG